VCLGDAAVDIRALGFEGDSAFQCPAKYLGALTGILGLVHLDVKCKDFEVRGPWSRPENLFRRPLLSR
jgi:hypothetical protein